MSVPTPPGSSDGDVAVGVATRRLAVDVLERVEQGAYANLALPAALGRSGLEEQDRALVTDLVYGTLRRRRACDAAIAPYLERIPSGAAHQALRIGAYQLRWRTDMPQYAAVDATVSAAPKKLRGLVNAVLRKVARASGEPLDEFDELSYPDWVVERLVGDLGESDALEALAQMNEPARPTLRADGYTQDLASQWVVEAVGARPGELVVDVDFGVFYWANSGGSDAISAADFGKACYIVDNQTVALTDASGTRSVAGIVYEVRADGQVGVRMDPTTYVSNP